ncbi:MAG: hypothetical protein L6W00_25370 [Lentisphaeria bacterium]|nr:MAG: hypothetical protein L6W00_25370 [Lentisphaeria bacterium]
METEDVHGEPGGESGPAGDPAEGTAGTGGQHGENPSGEESGRRGTPGRPRLKQQQNFKHEKPDRLQQSLRQATCQQSPRGKSRSPQRGNRPE